MKKSITIVLIICTLFLFSFYYMLIRDYRDFMCHDNPYILSMKADKNPVPFCPLILSTKQKHQYGMYFSSNGKDLFFTRCIDQGAVIMHSVHTPYGWSEPKPIDYVLPDG